MTIGWIDGAGQGTRSAEAAAVRAARSGRLDELELVLERIAVRDPHRARELGAKLRTLAHCVLAHPASAKPGLRAAM